MVSVKLHLIDERTNGRADKATRLFFRLFVRPFVSYIEFDTKCACAVTYRPT